MAKSVRRNASRPSNIYFFDVSSDSESRWVGAATVAASAADGFVTRIQLLDGLAYALTGRKGIQAIDVSKATDLFQNEIGTPFSLEYFSLVRRLNTVGQGFAQEAVSQPIPLTKDATRDFFQTDLAAARIQAEVWAATTGEAPLFLVNPVTRATTGSIPVETTVAPVSLLTSGSAIEIGQVGGRYVALIAGWGSVGGEPPGWAFAVVDVSTPNVPVTLNIISLPLDTAPTDILLTGNTAIVASEGQAALVNMSNPEQPVFAGMIEMVGGVLGVNDVGVLLSSARSTFGGDSDLGGVNTAALGHITVVTNVVESPVIVALDRTSIEPQTLTYRAIYPREDVTTSEMEILRDGVVHETFSVELNDRGEGEFTIPEGTEYPTGIRVEARLVVNRDEAERPTPTARLLPTDQFELFPQEDLAWSYVDEPLDVAALSDAAIERSQNESGPAPLLLHWIAVGSQPDDFTPSREASETGIYVTDFRPTRIAGTVQHIELRDEANRVLARSGAITALPGNVSIAFPVPPIGDPGRLPADGWSTIEVAVEQARDFQTNQLPDGTIVVWTVSTGDGEMLEAESSLLGGRATARYRAGTEPGAVTIRAEIEGRSEDRPRFIGLEQVPLRVEIERIDTFEFLTNLEVRVDSDAGPVADGADVAWGVTQGSITFQDRIVNGVGTAIYSALVPAGVPKPPTTGIFVTVGSSRAQISDFAFSFESSATPDITLEHYRLNGDNLTTVSVDFPAATVAHYSGGPPNGSIALELGAR